MKFWREFLSGNNDLVNSPTVIITALGFVLAAPVMGLSYAAVYHHVWTLKKGLDGPTVNLLLGMLGAATGTLGASMFSKSLGPPPGWKPPPLKKEE